LNRELQVDGRAAGSIESANAAGLDEAYATCRAIARREAKNFYYAFVALPKPKRNAICAIYAFMRQADDLADDESVAMDERRARLDAWLNAWRAASAGGATADSVFVAVRDAMQRYAIPVTLLDELVAGVTMDVDAGSQDAPDTYATFSDLYRYCYLVASVVGLVCIRIFGYSDPRAEKLAEETGIAFQLTNILRDVAEDAERNRVYLPLEDLKAHGVELSALLHRRKGSGPTENERALLREICGRAEGYYASAQALMPLIDKESRPALGVLVEIYHALLRQIESADYDVFSRRASVPTAKKLVVLFAGLARMAWVRALG
jgi:phytoene synthase